MLNALIRLKYDATYTIGRAVEELADLFTKARILAEHFDDLAGVYTYLRESPRLSRSLTSSLGGPTQYSRPVQNKGLSFQDAAVAESIRSALNRP